MLTLYYAPGACSLAAHIVLEDVGQPYRPHRMNLAQGEQKTPEYMRIHPLGRVPALTLEDGTHLTENTAILPYLGKRFGLWPTDLLQEAQALSLIGFFASSVHPANAHIGRPERYTEDTSAFPGIQAMGRKTYAQYLQQIDGMLAQRDWMGQHYSVLDPYALVFYVWGVRREFPVQELKHFTAFKDRMLQRPGVQKAFADEGITL